MPGIPKNKKAPPGMTRSPTWNSWMGMKARCDRKNATGYKHYGGRGISYCKRWKLFKNFVEDMGIKPEGKTLERINNSKNYSPSNCSWATMSEQNRNKRGYSNTGEKYITWLGVYYEVKYFKKNMKTATTFKNIRDAIKFRDSVHRNTKEKS